MGVVAISKTNAKPAIKQVEANQKSLDMLPPDSGMWKVKGFPGLYVRARATSKSFMVQRRIDGDLVKTTLGPLSMKVAREKAMKLWGEIERKESSDVALTFGAAVEQYIEAKLLAGRMAPKTVKIYRYIAGKYFGAWKSLTLAEIGGNRLGIRAMQQKITRNHGRATSNQCVRMAAAVYRWHRETNEALPEWAKKAAEIHNLKPRDWALSPDELRAWWHVERTGDVRETGVSTLGTAKRMWWLTALFTGARKGSIEALRWEDVDLEKKVIFFGTAKGGRTYYIPMSDPLADLLRTYRSSQDLPPSEWCFRSPKRGCDHLRNVTDTKDGVAAAHKMRHSFRTALLELGVGEDQARLLMGHSMSGVSRGYIHAGLVVESLRPISNQVAKKYLEILPNLITEK